MTRTREERGEQETARAEKQVRKTGKPAGGARSGITAPVEPSPELAKIIGSDKLPRSEAVAKVWEYIKQNHLQKPEDKREIMADDNLRKVFGGKSQVSMFEMNKHLSAHLK